MISVEKQYLLENNCREIQKYQILKWIKVIKNHGHITVVGTGPSMIFVVYMDIAR
ncbi:hypothetical protein HNR33_004383 [Brassicibacter mesophilus]